MPTEIGQPWRWSKDGETAPNVGVLVGSQSDIPKILPVYTTLEELEIPYETDITSAHRLPELMAEYSKKARKRGLQVLIAVAGGSAHLQGMMSGHTHLPLVGVAVGSSSESLDQSVKAQVGMPPGVPLLYAGAGKAGAENAALAAGRILSLHDEALYERVEARHQKMVRDVESHRDRLREIGPRAVAEVLNK